ncbi:MAG: hypothetical protein U9N02_01220 [Campylobacterota bacterium]|nr:hypothetical protein [Campylobacterota bacterium]
MNILSKSILIKILIVISFILFVFVYIYQDKIIGQIPIAYNYYQPINSKYLIETEQSKRIIPHRVNSIGKLNDIWEEGFRSFECDVRFGDSNTKIFRMGHDIGEMGTDFESFLLSEDYEEIEKIWLDFKNLNSYNYKEALYALNNLDEKYSLKKKLIVESGTKDNFFDQFSDNGYHTSYYLPTGLIKKLLKEKKSDEMISLAQNISKQTKLQKLSAISFYHEIYPFVKKFLEPRISKDIVYHIWYSPALYDNRFKSKLLNNELYLNERVKTLLGTYRSQHNL